MDVPSATAANAVSAAGAAEKLPPELKLAQILPAQVLAISPDNKQLTLAAAGYSLQLQSQQNLNLQPGQSVQLQVAKILPNPEFYLLTAPSADYGSSVEGQSLLSLIRISVYQSSVNPEASSMEINSSFTAYPALTNSLSPIVGLDLKLNQLVDAKVIETQVALNNFSLSVAGKTLQVQAQQPINLQIGQPLQLQVVKLLPVPEFKIVSPKLPMSGNQAASTADSGVGGVKSSTSGPDAGAGSLKLSIAAADAGVRSLKPLVSNQDAPVITLKLISPAGDNAASTLKPVNSAGPAINAIAASGLPALAGGQKITAILVSVIDNQLNLQMPAGPSASANTPGKPLTTGNQLLTLNAREWLYASPDGDAKRPAEAPGTALTPGTQINLQILKTGAQPVYVVSLPQPQPLISEQKINDVLKQLLPMQSSPAYLLNHLAQMLPVLENNPSVAETLKLLARQILTAIPAQIQLQDAGQVQHSIVQSGVFLETKLAELLTGQGEQNLGADLKFKLLKLVESLNSEIRKQGIETSVRQDSIPILKEVLDKTQSALAKITLDQFHSLPNEQSAKQVWMLELPFFHQRHANTVRIEIQQDKSHKHHAEEKHWAVSITITPPDLATIHCNISCFDGAINTRFWSDNTATVEKINTHLEHLKQQFELKGLKTGFMEAHQGKPAATANLNKPVANLLSEKV